MPHADEINKSPYQILGAHTLAEVDTWVEVGLQILQCVGWSPECATERAEDIERTFPPLKDPKRFYPGLFHQEHEEDRPPRRRNFRHSHEPSVYTGVAIVENIGLTASVDLYNNRVDHRNLYIHGLVLGTEQPTYLNEVAALHALRTIRDWIGSREEEQEKFGGMTLFAGDSQTAEALRRWYEKGELKLQSAAASPLVRDLNSVEN